MAELVLVRPNVIRPDDYITFLCALGLVLAYLFALALWAYGIFRTGLSFFYILIFSALLGLVLSAINVVVYYDPRFMPGFLGSHGFTRFFYCYIWLLLIHVVIGLIGATMMVRWILRTTRSPDGCREV